MKKAIVLALAACALQAGVAQAQDSFPSHPVPIIVPATPGGPSDLVAVSRTHLTPMLLAVNRDVPARTVPELVAYPRKPPAVIRKISADVRTVLATPELQARFEQLGLVAAPAPGDEFQRFVQA